MRGWPGSVVSITASNRRSVNWPWMRACAGSSNRLRNSPGSSSRSYSSPGWAMVSDQLVAAVANHVGVRRIRQVEHVMILGAHKLPMGVAGRASVQDRQDGGCGA